jgi:hypothetical protein
VCFTGEDLIPVQPLVVKELIEATTDGETMAQRYGVKLFLTNKRLFFLDAELDRVPSLTESSDVGGMVLTKLKVTFEVTDDIWYYPVPLTNLKGMSLDIHFATTATMLIAQKRPWWSVLISLIGFGMLAFAFYDHIVVRKRTSMQGVSEGEIESTLFGVAGALSLLGPMLFFFLKVYTKGDPRPNQKQERRVTLGVKDPITVSASLCSVPGRICGRASWVCQQTGLVLFALSAVPTLTRSVSLSWLSNCTSFTIFISTIPTRSWKRRTTSR